MKRLAGHEIAYKGVIRDADGIRLHTTALCRRIIDIYRCVHDFSARHSELASSIEIYQILPDGTEKQVEYIGSDESHNLSYMFH